LIKYLLGRVQEIIFIGSIFIPVYGDNAKALVYVNKALTWQKKNRFGTTDWNLIQAKLEIKKEQLKQQNYHCSSWDCKTKIM
jgi:hypothetical protein